MEIFIWIINRHCKLLFHVSSCQLSSQRIKPLNSSSPLTLPNSLPEFPYLSKGYQVNRLLKLDLFMSISAILSAMSPPHSPSAIKWHVFCFLNISQSPSVYPHCPILDHTMAYNSFTTELFASNLTPSTMHSLLLLFEWLVWKWKSDIHFSIEKLWCLSPVLLDSSSNSTTFFVRPCGNLIPPL